MRASSLALTNSSRSVMVSRRPGSGRGLVPLQHQCDWSGRRACPCGFPAGSNAWTGTVGKKRTEDRCRTDLLQGQRLDDQFLQPPGPAPWIADAGQRLEHGRMLFARDGELDPYRSVLPGRGHWLPADTDASLVTLPPSALNSSGRSRTYCSPSSWKPLTLAYIGSATSVILCFGKRRRTAFVYR